MAPKIVTLDIQHFRALRQLKIDRIGRVNLLTGRNNTGKSSVLEALRILASDADPAIINSILRYREEDLGNTEESPSIAAEGLFQLASLFHGFPRFSSEIDPIKIASSGGYRPMRLSIKVGLFSEVREPDGTRKLVPRQQTLLDDDEGLPALVIEVGETRRILSIDYPRRYASRGMLRTDMTGDSRLPCVYVSPYGGEQTATLGKLWDKIALSDLEKDVVDALRIIDPVISAVSMVGGEGPRQSRTAIVRTAGFPRPVPLRSFGDGLNRLFSIIVSLVNAKDGLLLIDEFENGMHYTVQEDAWRLIFKLAGRLDIQVVATTHSWDTVLAFQKAAADDPEEGALIRLSRKGEEIVPTVFDEDELAVVTRNEIEVR
ncbi:MAG: AAA family ATPase [Syntrophobacteraceae bacterium]|nr:AAA family ATPase [Syntrophobacteraceae bacterium]